MPAAGSDRGRAGVERLMLHEFVRTRGRCIADTLACRMPRPVRDRFSPALHSVAYCCDAVLGNPNAMPEEGGCVGISMADGVVAGEAIVIFADAHPRRGYAAASVYIDAIAAHSKGGARLLQVRSTSMIEPARKLSRATCTETNQRPTAHERQRLLIELAASILDPAALDRLRLMSGCLPLVAIVGDTRATGATHGQFYHAVTQMPGEWLGTAPSAGAA